MMATLFFCRGTALYGRLYDQLCRCSVCFSPGVFRDKPPNRHSPGILHSGNNTNIFSITHNHWHKANVTESLLRAGVLAFVIDAPKYRQSTPGQTHRRRQRRTPPLLFVFEVKPLPWRSWLFMFCEVELLLYRLFICCKVKLLPNKYWVLRKDHVHVCAKKPTPEIWLYGNVRPAGQSVEAWKQVKRGELLMILWVLELRQQKAEKIFIQ